MSKRISGFSPPRNHITYGIVYDVGDFPTQSDVTRFSIEVAINHIVISDSQENLEGFYCHVVNYSDLDFVFSTPINESKCNITLREFEVQLRRNFSEELQSFLVEKLEATI